jgi:Ca2+-binding RTX toxin-like protein
VLVDWQGLEASGYRDSRPPSYPYGDQDQLLGGEGDDELRSLAGSDILDGGAGNDRVVLGSYSSFPRIDFGAGGGSDIVDAYPVASGQPASLQVFLGAGLTSERVRFSVVAADLRVGFDGSADTLTFSQYAPASGASFGGRPLALTLADGVQLAGTEIGLALADADGAVVGAGDDFVQGSPQADELTGLAGADLLLGGGGADALDGGDGADRLHGGEGDDTISGGADADALYGNAGDDVLDGGSGDDILDGGPGDDILAGGAGDDIFRDAGGAGTYLFGAGFGRDSIEDRRDPALRSAVDAFVFDQSIDRQHVEVTRQGDSWLLIGIAGTSDQISVEGFDPTAGSVTGTLEEIRFADGTVWDHAELVRRSSSITGTEGADVLTAGGSGGVRMYGLGGNDSLTGGSGNDFLDGGAGADSMSGGFGDDTYVVDAMGDAVAEGTGQGDDLVLSSVTYTLGTNVERLTLTGEAAVNGTGNSLANALTGNGGQACPAHPQTGWAK